MRLKEDASATTPSALFSERDLFSYGAATPPHESSRGGESAVLRLFVQSPSRRKFHKVSDLEALRRAAAGLPCGAFNLY